MAQQFAEAGLPYHPYINLYPVMGPEEREALKRSIALNGVRKKVLVWTSPTDGTKYLADGRHRYEIAHELGIPCPSEEFDGDELALLDAVTDLNGVRRDLTSSQKAAIAVETDYMKARYAKKLKVK